MEVGAVFRTRVKTSPLEGWSPEVYVTRKDIEEMAGVTRHTVHSWQEKGYLDRAMTDYHDPTHVGWPRLYLRVEIEAFLETRKPSGRPRTSDMRANELRWCADVIKAHAKTPLKAVEAIMRRLEKWERDAENARKQNAKRTR